MVLANVTRVRQQAADKYIGTTVARQLRGADVVALSHTDLVPHESTITMEVVQWLRTMAPQAWIVPLDTDVQIAALAAEPIRNDVAWRPIDLNPPLHDHDINVHAMTFKRCKPIDLTHLRHILDTLGPEVVRAKGFVYGTETPETALLLQFAGGDWTLKPISTAAELPTQTTLVFHTTGGEAHVERLRIALDSI